MAYNILRIPKGFKFTEEVISITNTPLPPLDKMDDYNIIYENAKKCQNTSNNPHLKDSTICRKCYIEDFINKMLSIRKSKRKDFVKFQMNLREDKLKFLEELNELLVDCESYFNYDDYSTQLDYQFVINDLKAENSIKEPNDNQINFSEFLLPTVKKTQDSNNYKLDIFISHSSIDKTIASKLIIILKEALNIKTDRIRCTSVDGFKLEGGVNFDEQLRKEIEENHVFIGIISENSIKSDYVLFELGARWGLKRPLKPVITKKSDMPFVKAPLNNMHILNLSEISDVCQLVTEISELLSIDLEKPNVYLGAIDNLIHEINK